MMDLADVLALKFPEANFEKDIILQDDGEGTYIKKWNLPNIPLPTQSDLELWAVELDLQYRQQRAVQLRVYPKIQDQLDMLYNDTKNKTTTWVDTITAIKTAFPKPTI